MEEGIWVLSSLAGLGNAATMTTTEELVTAVPKQGPQGSSQKGRTSEVLQGWVFWVREMKGCLSHK